MLQTFANTFKLAAVQKRWNDLKSNSARDTQQYHHEIRIREEFYRQRQQHDFARR